MCDYEGTVHSYRLLAINRRGRNWNHFEHYCAARHGLENVKGEGITRGYNKGVTGVPHRELQHSVASFKDDIPPQRFYKG